MENLWMIAIAVMLLSACYDFSISKRQDSGTESIDGDYSIEEVPIGTNRNPSNSQGNVPVTTSYLPTSGGGEASSLQYRLYLNIGAPQPSGTASNERYRLTIGF
jgi:hypothetical protein